LANKELSNLIPALPGSYVIAGGVAGKNNLDHKRWSGTAIPEGVYFYCGSARGTGGLRARICRHLNQTASKFWHFDYLKPYLLVEKLWWICTEKNLECDFVCSLLSIKGASIPLSGFGASDCTRNCDSHLVFFLNGQSFTMFDDVFKKFLMEMHEFKLCKAGSSKIH
jgi:Uri superfamily endonuclease